MIPFCAKKSPPWPVPPRESVFLIMVDRAIPTRVSIDDSQQQTALTAYGTTATWSNTGIPVKFGTAMIQIGAGGIRRITDPTILYNGDFTCEMWAYSTVFGTVNTLFASADNAWLFGINATRGLILRRHGVNVLISADAVFPSSGWTHVAWMRVRGSHYLYVNGILVAGPYVDNAVVSYIGGAERIGSSTDAAANPYTGWIDGFRITRSAIYQAPGFAVSPYAFPVPVVPPIDYNSYQFANRLLITTPKESGSTDLINESAASLMTPVLGGTAQWSSNALLFGGNSIAMTKGEEAGVACQITPDCLLTAARAFTIEFWIQLTSYPTAISPIFQFYATSGTLWNIKVGTSGSLTIYEGTTSRAYSSSGISLLNTWYHVAWTRTERGENRLYRNGWAGSSFYTSLTQAVAPTTGSTAYFGNLYNTATGGPYGGYISQIRITFDFPRWIGVGLDPPYPSAALLPPIQKYDKDPLFSSTIFCLTNDNIIDSQDILDEGVGNATITPSTDCKYTDAQAKFGTTSIATGAGGLGWTASTQGTLPVAGSPATIEMWIFMTSYASGTATLWVSSTGWTLTVNVDGFPVLNLLGTPQLTGNINIPLYQWVHIALTRDSSNIHRIYVNGVVQTTTFTNVTVLGNSTATHRFCGLTSTSSPMPGYLDSARITNALRYSGAFTPPTTQFPNQ